MTMRTPQLEAEYYLAKKKKTLKTLYEETPVKDFKHWRIVENRFPHDKIAEVNHLLVLKREVEDMRHINLIEWAELIKIVWFIRDAYDTFTYNFPTLSSVKNIPHAHLYILKDELK